MNTPNQYSGRGGFTISSNTNASEAVNRFRGSGAERLRSSESRRRNLKTYAQAYADIRVKIILDKFDTASVKQPPDNPPIVRIPDNRYEQLATDFDREKFDQKIQYAMVVHELGHIRYTPSEYVEEKLDDLPAQQYESAQNIWNALEDGAIEEQLRHDLGEKIGERLATLHANLAEIAFEEAALPITYGFMPAVNTACLDIGRYDSGFIRRLRDADNDQFLWASDEHEALFEDFVDEIEQAVQDVLTTSDPYKRTDCIFEFWDDLMDYLGANDAEDNLEQPNQGQQGQQSQQGESQQGGDQGQMGTRGMPDDADSDSSHGKPQAAEDLGDETDEDDVRNRIRSVTKEEPQTEKPDESGQSKSAEQVSNEDDDENEDETSSKNGEEGDETESGGSQAESQNTDETPTEDSNGNDDSGAASVEEQNADGDDNGETSAVSGGESETSGQDPEIDNEAGTDSGESGDNDVSSGSVEDSDESEGVGSESEEAAGGESEDESGDGVDDSDGADGDTNARGSDEQKTLSDFGSNDSANTDSTDVGDGDEAEGEDDGAGSDTSPSSDGTGDEVDEDSDETTGSTKSRDNNDQQDSPNPAAGDGDSNENERSEEDDRGEGDNRVDGGSEDGSEEDDDGDEIEGARKEDDEEDSTETGKQEETGGGTDSNSTDENAPPGTGEDGLDLPDPDSGSDDGEEDPLDKQRRQEKQDAKREDKPLEEEISAFVDVLEDIADSDDEAANGAGNTDIQSLEFKPEPKGDFVSEAWAEAEDKSPNTANLLERELERERREDHRRGLPTGEVDGSQVYGLETGDLNIMAQRRPGREKDYSVVIVLDRSRSMNGSDIEIAEGAVVEFALALESIGVEVCIMDMYANKARLISPFRVDTEVSKEALVNRDASGGTPLHESLAIGRRRLETVGGETFILMVTDGKPGDKDAYTNELQNCHMPVLGINLALGEDRQDATERLRNQKQYYDSNAIVTSKERLNRELELLIYNIAF